MRDEDTLFIFTLINNQGFDTNVKHPRRFCDAYFLDEIEQNKDKYHDFYTRKKCRAFLVRRELHRDCHSGYILDTNKLKYSTL